MPSDSNQRLTLSQMEPFVTPVLIIDVVFRGFSLLGLLLNLSTYLPSIGVLTVLLKAAMYIGGIVANIAILQGRPWGTAAGFGVAGVGIWFVLGDAWSLLTAPMRGAFWSSLPKSMYLRASLKTMARTVWQAVYLGAVWVAHRKAT